MLEIKYVRQNIVHVREAMNNRGDASTIDAFEEIDTERRKILNEIEHLRHERNVASDEIAKMKARDEDAGERILEMREVASRIKAFELELAGYEEKIQDILINLPNIPHESVPFGKDDNDNPVIREVGTPKAFDFEALPHWTIGEHLGILDFERAAKITGARFPLYFGAGARLERALINFMIDFHVQSNGYKETLPPFIVNSRSMTNTGQLPKFAEDLFKLENRDYYLIPTAEVPVTNIHQDEILDEADLPIFYVAYTPCFRSEAGSYGKDTRGLIRQHQFNKVELVKFTSPEDSYPELESLLENAESVLKRLELPYRTVLLCTGDMGFASAKTYDIEVWMPAQNRYREISSCSNFEAFQSRRAGIRFRRKGKKGTQLVHTLNGSGLAVGRTLAAILENGQQADGSVVVPEALRPYMGGLQTIEKTSVS